MKKRSLILAILVLTLSLLVGCFEEASPTGTDVGEVASEQKQPADNGSLEVVSMHRRSGYLLHGAETENGYYESHMWEPDTYENPDDFQKYRKSNIVFTDYATATQTYLCSVPACTHGDESCTSYIEHSGFLTLFQAGSEDQIFMLSTSRYLYDDVIATYTDTIYKMDIDGSNREEFYVLPANEVFADSQVVADDNSLYVVVAVYTDATEEPKRELRKIDITTGQAEAIVELTTYQYIDAAYEDTFVLVEWSLNETTSREQRPFELPEGETTGTKTIGYSLSTGEMKELYNWRTQEAFHSGRYHFAKAHTGDNKMMLIIIDLSTGERKEISGLPTNDASDARITDFIEGNVIYEYATYEDLDNPVTDEGGKLLQATTDTFSTNVVNLETGEHSEINLPYSYGYTNDNAQIYAQSENEFLVISGKTESLPITRYGNDGVPYETTTTVLERAVITKDDYFNSVPNFRYIESLL